MSATRLPAAFGDIVNNVERNVGDSLAIADHLRTVLSGCDAAFAAITADPGFVKLTPQVRAGITRRRADLARLPEIGRDIAVARGGWSAYMDAFRRLVAQINTAGESNNG